MNPHADPDAWLRPAELSGGIHLPRRSPDSTDQCRACHRQERKSTGRDVGVFSDAGAARGALNPERLAATGIFLERIRRSALRVVLLRRLREDQRFGSRRMNLRTLFLSHWMYCDSSFWFSLSRFVPVLLSAHIRAVLPMRLVGFSSCAGVLRLGDGNPFRLNSFE